jgi:hypothetical protein
MNIREALFCINNRQRRCEYFINERKLSRALLKLILSPSCEQRRAIKECAEAFFGGGKADAWGESGNDVRTSELSPEEVKPLSRSDLQASQ